MSHTNRKYEVFVSSAYEGLQEERQAVYRAIVALGHVPVGMESFVAADIGQFDFIKEQIDSADCVIVVLATRYGSVNSETEKSMTELEFDYAEQTGKYVIPLVLTPERERFWVAEKLEKGVSNSTLYDGHRDSLASFRGRLLKDRMGRFWSNAGDLENACTAALSFFERKKALPGTGWVPATVLKEHEKIADEYRQNISVLTAELNQKGDQIEQLERELAETQEKLRQTEAVDEIISGQVFLFNIRRVQADIAGNRGADSSELRKQLALLLSRFRKLVEETQNAPWKLTSDDIERVGDASRQYGDYDSALWLYQQATERNPNNISARIEWLSLRTELIPADRDATLTELQDIGSRCTEEQLKRILNAFIEVQAFSEMDKFCTHLLERGDVFPSQTKATILRNRAVARRQLGGLAVGADVMDDIEEALKLDQEEENNIKVYASFLEQAGRSAEAAKQFAILLRKDSSDVAYYAGLSKCLVKMGRGEQAANILEEAENAVPHEERATLRLLRAKLFPTASNNQIVDDLLNGLALP